MRTDPLLVINPVGDRRFAAACAQAMETHPLHPEELEAILRRSHPSVVVRPRALSGEPLVIWYVYRDGHWVSSP